MREPPVDLPDHALAAGLRAHYGLAVTEVAFLPLGHDASAWVYQVHAADHPIPATSARATPRHDVRVTAGRVTPALHRAVRERLSRVVVISDLDLAYQGSQPRCRSACLPARPSSTW